MLFRVLVTMGSISFAGLYLGAAPKSKIQQSYEKSVKVQHKKFRSGDTVYSLLQHHGFSRQQVNNALAKEILPQKFTLIPDEIYRTVEDSAAGTFNLLIFDPQKDIIYRYWRGANDTSGAEAKNFNYTVKLKTVTGQVRGSILESLMKNGVDQLVAYRFLDAYVMDYDLAKVLQRGAGFSLTYEEKYDGTNFIKFGEILRTELEIAGRMQAREFIRFPNGGAFIDTEDTQENRPLFAPVEYLRVTSLFKNRRYHPIRKRRIAHLGVDFELPAGEKVLAANSGKVFKKGKNRGAGYYVGIKHNDGLTSYYNHLSKIADSVTIGKRVKAGEEIGAVGCTGFCTKPHLHFAVKKNNRFVDPLDFMKSFPYSRKKFVIPKFQASKDKPKKLTGLYDDKH